MTTDGPTRRALLRAAGATATAALGGVAGCLGPRLSRGRGEDERGYRRWLPSRGSLGVGTETQYAFVTMDVAAAAAAAGEDRFAPPTATAIRRVFAGELLPAFGDVDLLVSVQTDDGGLVAIEGSFPADELAERFTGGEYDRETAYAGYDVFTGTGGGTIGLADGILLASGGTDPVGSLQGAIDASEGDADLVTDASDDADALVSALGDGLFANGGLPAGGVSPGLDSGTLAANGLRGRLSGGTTEVRQVLVYDAPGDVDTGAIQGASGTAAALDGAGVERSGRTALVEGSLPTDELRPGDLFGVAINREDSGERARVDGSPAAASQSVGARRSSPGDPVAVIDPRGASPGGLLPAIRSR